MSKTIVTILVIGTYLLVVGLVGWRGKVLADKSDMFNIFGRRARTIRAAAGYLSLIGGGELITISQFGYDNGFHVMWFLGGIVLGFLVLAAFSERLRLKAAETGATTFSGFFADQYGPAAGVGISLTFLISLGSLLSIQFIVGSDLIHATTGIPKHLASILMAGIIVSYLLAAGYVAVLSTDVLRAMFMSLALVGICVFLYVAAPIPITQIKSTPLPQWDGPIFSVLGIFGVICAADVWQTIFASEDRTVTSRSLVIGALCFLVFGLLIAQIGFATKLIMPNLLADKPALIAATETVIPGILGPLIALLVVGSVMATADTEIWVISTVLSSNRFPSASLFARQHPTVAEPSEAFHDELRRWTRFLIPAVTAVALALAYLSGNAQALYQSLLALLTAIAPVVLTVMFSTPPPAAVTVGLWAALGAFFALFAGHGAEIPTSQSLLPPLCSAIGMLVGCFFSNGSSGGTGMRQRISQIFGRSDVWFWIVSGLILLAFLSFRGQIRGDLIRCYSLPLQDQDMPNVILFWALTCTALYTYTFLLIPALRNPKTFPSEPTSTVSSWFHRAYWVVALFSGTIATGYVVALTEFNCDHTAPLRLAPALNGWFSTTALAFAQWIYEFLREFHVLLFVCAYSFLDWMIYRYGADREQKELFGEIILVVDFPIIASMLYIVFLLKIGFAGVSAVNLKFFEAGVLAFQLMAGGLVVAVLQSLRDVRNGAFPTLRST